MALNLQVRSRLADLSGQLEAGLRASARLGDPNLSLTDLRYIEGSGSTSETLIGELTAAGVTQTVVALIRSGDMQPFLDQRLGRQVAIIDWVAANTDVPVPKVLLADQAGEVMGRPLMVLRHVAGRAPVDYPGYNVAGFLVEMAPDARRRLWEGAMDMLCRLHRADASSIDFLDFPGTARADLPDLLTHWGASLDWAGGDIDQAAFGEVLGWLRREAPTDAPKGLSWGDARPGNMLFDGERCAAVLDWDLASTAGPLVDLSWWLVFDRIQDEDTGVPRLEGLGSRAETLDLWAAATGHSLAHLRWHEVLAHFQLAVTRAKAFGDRRRAGWTVPADDDPRSVLRLQRRIEALLGKDA